MNDQIIKSIETNTWCFDKYEQVNVYCLIKYLDEHKIINLSNQLFNMLNDAIIKINNNYYIFGKNKDLWVYLYVKNIPLIDFCIDLKINIGGCYTENNNRNDLILRRKGVIDRYPYNKQIDLIYNNIYLLIN